MFVWTASTVFEAIILAVVVGWILFFYVLSLIGKWSKKRRDRSE